MGLVKCFTPNEKNSIQTIDGLLILEAAIHRGGHFSQSSLFWSHCYMLEMTFTWQWILMETKCLVIFYSFSSFKMNTV